MQRISTAQKKLLVRLVDENLHIVNGRFQSAQGSQFTQNVWGKMKEALNAIGPMKTTEQWKKCWKNLRLGLKAKTTKLRQYRTATGGGGPSNITFSEEEERMMAMIGIEMFDGAPDVPEGGIDLVTAPLQTSVNSTISFGPEDFEICDITLDVPTSSTMTNNLPSTPLHRYTSLHRPTPLHQSTPINRSIATPSVTPPQTATTFQVPSSVPRTVTPSPRRAAYQPAVDRSIENQNITIDLLRQIVKALEKNNTLLENIEKKLNCQ